MVEKHDLILTQLKLAEIRLAIVQMYPSRPRSFWEEAEKWVFRGLNTLVLQAGPEAEHEGEAR
jgi:hypothetical protein